MSKDSQSADSGGDGPPGIYNSAAPLSPQESIVRSASVVSVAVLMSRVTGLVREIVMARLFGAGQIYDAFLLGFRIPNLTRDLFAEGALTSAFVPAFVQHLGKSRQAAARLASLVGTMIILGVGGVCVLGAIFSPALVQALAPGFSSVPGKHEMAVSLTRIMFPFLLLVALAAQVMGMLNACNRFAVPALSSSLFNIGSLFFGLIAGYGLGPRLGLAPIEGMAWGVVFGGAAQLLFQAPALWREGFHFRPAFDPSHPGLRQVLLLMGPAILGSAATQINVMVNTNFASRIADPVRGPDGAVSWLAYAFRFMQLPLGLFGVALASATLPAISRSAALGDMDEFRRTLSRSIGIVFLLTIPSSAGLAVLGESMIGAVFEGGQFNAYDTRQTAVALACFAVGLAGYSALKVLVPAFYALDDSRTPMIVSFASILINYAVVSLAVDAGFGHGGLALSTSVVAVFGFVALFWVLRNRLGGIHGRALTGSVIKVSFASALMAGAVSVSSRLIALWLGDGRLARLSDLAISIPLGLAVYYMVCRMVRVAELEVALGALTAPLRRLRAKSA